MAAEEIIDIYERHADRWIEARLRNKNFAEKNWIDRFSALIPAHGSILDCGCGAGEPVAAYLVAKGYEVTGVDSSTAMIRRFQARLSDQCAFVADMRDLSLGKNFQAILAWDSFFHLPHADQRRMFATFRTHAAPGAALMFTSGASFGESIGSLEGEPLYHASLDPSEYRTLFAEHGFMLVATAAQDPDCGGRTIWLAQRSQ